MCMAEVPDTCAVGGKTGVVRGFRSIEKNCACAGEKRLPEVMCCLEREKNAPNIEL